MSLNFLNPNLLWLLGLAAVPLLLHLFARSRPPVYEFSSVAFLRRIVRKTMRFRKPQDILLLVLRTLAVLALAGAFLRPLLFSQEKLSGLLQRKNLVAIVDASASMGYVEGAQTRFATACAETAELLSGLSGRDRANIVWAKADPEAVFPDGLASNLGFLEERLRRASVTSERGSPEKAFALAVDLLAEAEGKREICVVSDYQRSAWEKVAPNLPEKIDLIHVRIGREQARNRAVTRLSHEPSRPVVGEELALHAEIRNFSDEDLETTVFSEVGEGRRSRNLSLAAGARTTVTFRHAVSSAGPLPVAVSLAEDAFPGDDRRMGVVRVRPFLRVATVAGDDPETARIWTRATQALQWAVPDWKSIGDWTAESSGDHDVVLLAGAEPQSDSSFPQTTKVVQLPPVNASISPPFSNGAADEGSIQTVRKESEEEPFSLRLASRDSPLFDLFRSGDHGSLEGPAGRARITLSDIPEGEPLLTYGDGAPALVRVKPNRYLWLAPLSDEPGNLGGRVEFLPFFGELLLADRLHGSERADPIDFEPGETVLWTAPEPIAAEDLRLESGDADESGYGGESTVDETEKKNEGHAFRAAGGTRFQASPFRRPGIYEWTLKGGPVGYSVVNFPVVESDLDALTLEEARQTASVAVRGGTEVRHLRDGLKLWPWLLAAAAVFFALECGVALWAARTPRPTPHRS